MGDRGDGVYFKHTKTFAHSHETLVLNINNQIVEDGCYYGINSIEIDWNCEDCGPKASSNCN